ncbi:hypothetical protein [Thiobaca trueperi]|uniref:Uncharacterized protein n=1 Tax=Thiobaca trueperi TaxID=127458 RepID=A0A4R3MSM1_9GAMM|nr:hypothetical protein [Thiobaca trueperi]TCT18975.1 hypothetical protein EDC35_11022 [Thiobaca trueperi]
MLVAVITLLAHWLWPILYPQPVQIADRDPGCDLRSGACMARLPQGGAVSFEIGPRTIPLLSPLRLDVGIQGLDDVRAVEVDFVGVEMNMGFNRVALTRIQAGHYTGQATLPVCTSTRMTWEARVLIQTPDALLAAPFRFETTR